MTKKEILKELDPYLESDEISWILVNSWVTRSLNTQRKKMEFCINCHKKLGESPLEGVFCNATCQTVYWDYES